MSVSLYFFIEVKDADGNWHLVKWYSDRKFDTEEPTEWDFQKEVEVNGNKMFENYEICPGLAWRDELGWYRNFGGLKSYKYPDDVSGELDELLKSHGELEKKNRYRFGMDVSDYDYKKKYECVYLSDMYDICGEKKKEWVSNIKKRMHDKEFNEIIDRLKIIESCSRGLDVKPYQPKKNEDDCYEDTLDYYFEEEIENIMALYRETHELHEKACTFTGDRWFDSKDVRIIYYFD